MLAILKNPSVVRGKRSVRRLLPKHSGLDASFPLSDRLRADIIRIDREDPVDPGGYCEFHKKHILASLISQNGLMRSVEIGVYRGSSLLTAVAAMAQTGGVACGIDPFDGDVWEQKEGTEIVERAFGKDWRATVDRLDWDGFMSEVVGRIEGYGWAKHYRLIRGLSHEVADEVEDGIGLLHIDGNHDFEAVALDVEKYVPKVASGGFVVFDDIPWPGVAPHYAAAREKMKLVFEDHGYGVLQKP